MKSIYISLIITTLSNNFYFNKDFVINLLNLESVLNFTNQKKENSADCEQYIVKKEDLVTGDTFYANKNNFTLKSNSNEITIFFIKQKKSIILSFSVFGASDCVDKGSKINFLFDNEKRLELKNYLNFNCDNNSTLLFYNKNKIPKDLLNCKIKIVRIWTLKGYVEIVLSEDEKNMFQNIINCLYNI